jgi:hypothetical protein
MTNVAGTAFDFRTAHKIGDLASDALVQSEPGYPGYDHNWVVNGTFNQMRDVAKYRDPISGRIMTIQADQPGVQFYTTNYRPAAAPFTLGKGGVAYRIHEALALETQKHPNAINFPSTVTPGAEDEIVRGPSETYTHTMIHKFTTDPTTGTGGNGGGGAGGATGGAGGAGGATGGAGGRGGGGGATGGAGGAAGGAGGSGGAAGAAGGAGGAAGGAGGAAGGAGGAAGGAGGA